ncbi:hypothetical protein GGP41_007208 [Bipolaris sorokiniana]|uniref:Uncharacterized protein n=1 Tax=Cochliobolus sativus TaxID=45130 RepID=A0A8H5ZU71_COCSA|nr:hypothetical protein GGP41_007208 [Bipolaris sorokiniana]
MPTTAGCGKPASVEADEIEVTEEYVLRLFETALIIAIATAAPTVIGSLDSVVTQMFCLTTEPTDMASKTSR